MSRSAAAALCTWTCAWLPRPTETCGRPSRPAASAPTFSIVLSAGPILRLEQDLVPVPASGGDLNIPEITAQKTEPGGFMSSRIPTLEEVERNHILTALQQSGGVVEGPKGAAKILNLHPNTLRHRMNKFGIKRSRHRLS